MGEVSVTSASQILESLWIIWSQVTQRSVEPLTRDEYAIPAHGSGTYTVYAIMMAT